MHPIKTRESNFVYRGPSKEIMDLPCRLEGNDKTFAVWEFTAEERQLIAAGANLRLGIYTRSAIPPVSLGVVAPNGPWTRVPAPCVLCNREVDHPNHGVGPESHAFKMS